MCPSSPFSLAAKISRAGHSRNCEPEKLGGPRRNSGQRLGSGMGCDTKSQRSRSDLPEENCVTWLSKSKSHLVKFAQDRAVCVSGGNTPLVEVAGKWAMVSFTLGEPLARHANH